jgi:hypothetical protein
MDHENGAASAPIDGTALTGALLDDNALRQLLHQVTLLARRTVSGTQSVSITVSQGGRYWTSNSTGPDALAMDEAQYDQGDGPCLQSMRAKRQLQVDVGAETDRWPLLAQEAGRSGIAGVLSTPLIPDGGDVVGALNVYAPSAGFADADMCTAQLLGEHAAILVGYALACTQLNDQLRQAVATREVIGTAKGILMQSQSCSRDEAFDILRRASQRQNRKLRDIAEELVVRVESRGVGNGRK